MGTNIAAKVGISLQTQKDSSSLYSKKFRLMLELLDHPDGGPWTGKKLAEATNKQVIPSYFTGLRDGYIGIPRADKIEAIADAMGFPPELWFKPLEWWQDLYSRWKSGEEISTFVYGDNEETLSNHAPLSVQLEHLFQTKINKDTGQAFTEEEVARYSRGILTEQDVKDMRSGTLANPSWRQLLALCRVFEVNPSYWSGENIPWSPSPAIFQRFGDADSVVTFQNSLEMSKDERSMLRTLSDYLKRGHMGDAPK